VSAILRSARQWKARYTDERTRRHLAQQQARQDAETHRRAIDAYWSRLCVATMEAVDWRRKAQGALDDLIRLQNWPMQIHAATICRQALRARLASAAEAGRSLSPDDLLDLLQQDARDYGYQGGVDVRMPGAPPVVERDYGSR
jgi:hypothetical protein